MTTLEKKEILKCFPCYRTEAGVRVNDIIQIQHVMAKFPVGGALIIAWLNEMAAEGLLEYDEGGCGRTEGWHLTTVGYRLLYG